MQTAFKSIVVFLLVIIGSNMAAQNSVGIYNMSSGSPEGGSSLVILENGKFVILYFGGAQIGYWKNTGNNTILFTPYKEESSFQVYGRKNNLLKNKIKIAFFGFENASTFISSHTSKPKTFKRVFNEDANCFAPLYTKVFDAYTKEIYFAVEQGLKDPEVVSFGTEGYNDFVAYYIPSPQIDSFVGVMKEDKLYIEENEGVVKRDLPSEGEDILFIRDLANSIDQVEDVKNFNPQYNSFQAELPSYYVFDESKGAYIDLDEYKEGMELDIEEYDYDDISILYEYKRCIPNIRKASNITIDEGSVFIERCE
ncbi:hypothetical protein M0D21_19190 [Aquimarina sp. D1M17]|uniref:hypothetical protein n=1 Tax=Aquimarina acroporae TaxID=2937283 RepID=UPI0020BE10CA|nr:hypothetical protein [Aquimarina acroporae]MCK8523716.1 hypothetical protein [Aquimarina acroporae]